MANLSGWPFYFSKFLNGGFHMERTLIGPKELAHKLDVPLSWIYSRTRTNEIPCVKVGKYVKFDESEIWKWLEQQNEAE